jgi:hypothetical protein
MDQMLTTDCDDEGWNFFVSDEFVGETHDWQVQPHF